MADETGWVTHFKSGWQSYVNRPEAIKNSVEIEKVTSVPAEEVNTAIITPLNPQNALKLLEQVVQEVHGRGQTCVMLHS